MTEIVAVRGWEELVAEAAEQAGVTLLLGRTDVGKSTLARFLVDRLVAAGRTTALVDADVGQSWLCVPGSVGMKVFRSPDDLSGLRCDRLAFLGSPSPLKVFAPLLESVGRLTTEARAAAFSVVVDTGGLVDGEAGRGLKLAKIRALQPERVVAVERERECEPILSMLDEVDIVRLAPSPYVHARSRETRARWRELRAASWFAGKDLREMLFRRHDVTFTHLGRPIDLTVLPVEPGTLAGLCRGKETLELGLVTEADSDGVTVETPLQFAKGVNRIELSEIIMERPPEG